jgi:hypothetical protein
MKDNRKHKRVESKGKDIHCRVQFTTEVGLINISSTGASIRLNKQLNMGQEYSINIKRNNKSIAIKGTVVWEKLIASEKNEVGDLVPVYKAGLKFNDIMTEKGGEIIDFISKNLVPSELQSRLRGIRVDISGSPNDTLTNNHKHFSVLKISLGGMLLQTDSHMKLLETSWMELNFPERERPLKFLGKVVTSSEIPGKKPVLYETGMEIIRISDEDRAMLNDIIESLKERID